MTYTLLDVHLEYSLPRGFGFWSLTSMFSILVLLLGVCDRVGDNGEVSLGGSKVHSRTRYWWSP